MERGGLIGMTYLIAFSIEKERERDSVSALNADLWKDALLLEGQCGWKKSPSLDRKTSELQGSCSLLLCGQTQRSFCRHCTKGDVRQTARQSHCWMTFFLSIQKSTFENGSKMFFKNVLRQEWEMLNSFRTNWIKGFDPTLNGGYYVHCRNIR